MFGCSLISEMQSLFVCQHSFLRECVFPQSIKSSHVNHYLASSLRPQLIWSDWLPDASQSNQIPLPGNPLPVGPATVRWYRSWDLVLKINEQSKPVQRESGTGREREAKQSTIWFQRETEWVVAWGSSRANETLLYCPHCNSWNSIIHFSNIIWQATLCQELC